MTGLDLAVIGNCEVAAMIDRLGRIVWSCVPRFDGDPVFCALLDGGEHERGVCAVELEDCVRSEQRYLPNTAIAETILHDAHGAAVRVVDFAPRFSLYDRTFHPMMLIRRIEPVAGSATVRLRIRPRFGYGAIEPSITHGSHHIRYVGPQLTLRVTTDASINAVLAETPFVLNRELTLVIGSDESVTESIPDLGRRFLAQTQDYWHSWSRGLSIPFEWQDAVIRAAITLKLCTYEDTGAVVAALTTSIPEAANSSRNWDYRYCWLRDSYFVVQALNRLGATRTMEEYLRFIINLAVNTAGGELQPVYGLNGETQLDERLVDSLQGYRGMGPVRVGNMAYRQRQNDVYGAVVLSATQAFFDSRLVPPADRSLLERLEPLGQKALEVYARPDAGLWEYRSRERVHTFSSVICWAACDRLARIAERLGQPAKAQRWREHAAVIHGEVCAHAWHEGIGAFTESFGREELDASLLLMADLHFVAKDDPRFIGTVSAIEAQLLAGRHMFRYTVADDLGLPETAFNVCTFWYIGALANIGRRDEARELFEHMLSCRNPLGLLSEDFDPRTNELWGNFPQTYSMVGVINAATRLSASWEEAL